MYLVHNATNVMDSTDSTDSIVLRGEATLLHCHPKMSHLLTVNFFHNPDMQARSTKLVPNPGKKFNIVIYGIDKYPKGTTTRSERLTLDLSKIVSVVSGINSNIHSQCRTAFT